MKIHNYVLNVRKEISDKIQDICGYGYEFSESFCYKLYKILITRGEKEYCKTIDRSIDKLKKNKGTYIYWLLNNFTNDIELAKIYANNLNIWNHCKICNNIFKYIDKEKTSFCSQECKDISKNNRISKIKISRNSYNYKDPKQYSEKNNIPIEEAENIIHDMNLNQKRNSKLSITYWVDKGYSEEDAKKLISDIQKNRSPLTIRYWMNFHNLSEIEAKNKIKELQSKRSNKRTKEQKIE